MTSEKFIMEVPVKALLHMRTLSDINGIRVHIDCDVIGQIK